MTPSEPSPGERSPATYDGRIDWIALYARYYDLDAIHARLHDLAGDSGAIVFAGFAEIAARLSTHRPVHLVEYSESMAAGAASRFPAIPRLSRADITHAVSIDPAPVVMVTCRVSAYWHEVAQLERFLDGVARLPRALLVVDFFTRGGQAHSRALGRPVHTAPGGHPDHGAPRRGHAPTLLRVTGGYPLDGDVVDYDELRAFFDPAAVGAEAKRRLPGAEVTIEPPLVSDDAGFTLVARWPSPRADGTRKEDRHGRSDKDAEGDDP